jgi:hypothetical protein
MADPTNPTVQSPAGALPPPPAGFVPDTSSSATSSSVPPPPAGFVADQPSSTSLPSTGNVLGDAALGALKETQAPERGIGENLLGGVAKGASESVTGLANLAASAVEKLLGKPEGSLHATRVETETPSTARDIGEFAENVGEFATGEHALKGAVAMAHMPEAVLALMEKYPTAAKIFTSAAKAGTVGAAQGAVKGAAEGDAVRGAEGGAAGGVIGGAAGEILGAGAKKAMSLFGVGRDAAGEMMQVARPGKWDKEFTPNFLVAAPRMAEELKSGPWKNLEDVADAALNAKNNLWHGDIADAIARHEDNFLNVTSIADDLRQKAANPTLQAFSPEGATALENSAKIFDKQGGMKVGDVEDTLEHLNAKLTNDGWWKKSGAERAAAAKVGDPLAVTDEAARLIREKLYDHLENAGEPEIRNLKQEYGALAKLEHHLRGQVNVRGRQVPLSLKDMVALTGAAVAGPKGWMAAAIPMIDHYVNNPTRMAARAVRNAVGEEPMLMKAGRVAGPAVKAGIRAAGAQEGQSIEENSSEPISENLPELPGEGPLLQDSAESQTTNPVSVTRR